MADLALLWGGDLQIGPTGDLATVTADAECQQRVLRRLLTNTGDYVWQPTYGAGLGAAIGTPVNALQIRALIRGQLFREASVASVPEPVIGITASTDGSALVELRYSDATSGATQLLQFSVDI